MTGKVLASAVLGLGLLCACSTEQPDPLGGRAMGPIKPPGPGTGAFPNTGTPAGPTPTGGLATPGGFGTNPDGLAQIAGTTGSLGAGGGGAPKTETCGATDITNGRVQPKVWLVIDGSGSMADPLVPPTDPQMPAAGPSRWDSLRSALMDPNGGVVPTLEKLVQFGMVMYDGPLGGAPGTLTTLPDGGPATGMPPTEECPRLATVEPALNNFAALNMQIPMLAPGGSTPTHKALAQVLSHLPVNTMVPDGTVDPTYVVLATDGAPNDFCAGGMGGLGGIFGGNGGPDMIQQEVVSLTTRIQMQGIPVYVISLAANDARLATHLQAVATAGGTMQPPFEPQNKDQLVSVFQQIIGPEAVCTVKLTQGYGVMQSVACMGTVELSGEKLECDSDNGWKLRDPKTIEITGSACEKFKAMTNARLTAFFPCEIQIPG